jgi:mono/diheme cytochrome c family protein
VLRATGIVGLRWALVAASGVLAVAFPLGAALPVERQNALVQRHCAVCHTDAARNGGLTLQHFDAARPDPSLAAMLLSKLRGGAMGAAGLPFEKADADALEVAMLASSAGAQQWTVTPGPVATAGIVREVASKNPEQPSRYRLVVSCDVGSGNGDVQLSWAPSPRNGAVKTSVDGGSLIGYKVEGTESMGNGSSGTTGHAAVMLDRLPWPERTLTISDLFPGETVVFPFDQLAPATRQAFAACFAPGK